MRNGGIFFHREPANISTERDQFFIKRVIPLWNNLHQALKEARKLNNFKAGLDNTKIAVFIWRQMIFDVIWRQLTTFNVIFRQQQRQFFVKRHFDLFLTLFDGIFRIFLKIKHFFCEECQKPIKMAFWRHKNVPYGTVKWLWLLLASR